MRSTRFGCAVAIGAAAFATATTANADLLYGIDIADQSIFTLDTNSGNLTKYFGFPVQNFGGLDFDSSGNLYLQQFGSLFRIDDLNNGQFTPIGGNNGRAFESFEIIGSTAYSADVFDGGLYRVDLNNNNASLVGVYGDDGSRITALASNESDTLYGARIFQSDVVRVNPNNGQVLGTIAQGLPANVTSLTAGSNNNLWFIPAFETTLYSIDLNSGQTTVVLQNLNVQHVTGLAFIPAPGAGALIALAGAAAARRRR